MASNTRGEENSGVPVPKVSRRRLVQAGAVATAGVLGGAAGAATLTTKIIALSEVKPGTPVSFLYPQPQPAILLDAGKPVPGGVGPGRSIVAYSGLCQHMGCPVTLEPASKHFVCLCHNSVYDPVRQGMAIDGPTPEGLPMITLKIENGVIYAVGISPVPGVSSGLVYGLACDA